MVSWIQIYFFSGVLFRNRAKVVYLSTHWTKKKCSYINSNYSSLTKPKNEFIWNGSLFLQVDFLQNMYVQYAEYMADVPNLFEFHTCFWMRLDETVRTSTVLNYARESLNLSNISILDTSFTLKIISTIKQSRLKIQSSRDTSLYLM